MNPIIKEGELGKLIKLEGEVRGISLKSDAEFIIREKGEDGLMKLEEAMAELGYPIKYKEIKPMEFYPIRLLAITTSLVEKMFGFNREKFREMGLFASRVPLAIRIFMKYFGSFDILSKAAPRMWRTYYTTGNLKVVEHNKEKRHATIRVTDYFLPLHQCYILEGYIAGVVRMVVKDPVICEETKCIHKGNEYHEFSIKW